MSIRIGFFMLAKIAFVLMLLLVMVLSLAPVSQPDFSPNDKVNHFIAYGALSLVGLVAFKQQVATIVGLFCYGILIEFLQGLTEYRFASAADVVANSLGLAIGTGIFALCYITFLKNSRLYKD
ncbi:VanZ family protein [Reinekea marina]|uniref:VanZ family protein n=2 Tax=Reinekea marina TaxID=1310421 RepID=A0ABV7WUT6_9GAMM